MHDIIICKRDANKANYGFSFKSVCSRELGLTAHAAGMKLCCEGCSLQRSVRAICFGMRAHRSYIMAERIDIIMSRMSC